MTLGRINCSSSLCGRIVNERRVVSASCTCWSFALTFTCCLRAAFRRVLARGQDLVGVVGGGLALLLGLLPFAFQLPPSNHQGDVRARVHAHRPGQARQALPPRPELQADRRQGRNGLPHHGGLLEVGRVLARVSRQKRGREGGGLGGVHVPQIAFPRGDFSEVFPLVCAEACVASCYTHAQVKGENRAHVTYAARKEDQRERDPPLRSSISDSSRERPRSRRAR